MMHLIRDGIQYEKADKYDCQGKTEHCGTCALGHAVALNKYLDIHG